MKNGSGQTGRWRCTTFLTTSEMMAPPTAEVTKNASQRHLRSATSTMPKHSPTALATTTEPPTWASAANCASAGCALAVVKNHRL